MANKAYLTGPFAYSEHDGRISLITAHVVVTEILPAQLTAGESYLPTLDDRIEIAKMLVNALNKEYESNAKKIQPRSADRSHHPELERS